MKYTQVFCVVALLPMAMFATIYEKGNKDIIVSNDINQISDINDGNTYNSAKMLEDDLIKRQDFENGLNLPILDEDKIVTVDEKDTFVIDTMNVSLLINERNNTVVNETLIGPLILDGKIPSKLEEGTFLPVKMPTEFGIYDKDKDGQISEDELINITGAQENADGAFNASDKNGDRMLSREEFYTAPWSLEGVPDDAIQDKTQAANIANEIQNIPLKVVGKKKTRGDNNFKKNTKNTLPDLK